VSTCKKKKKKKELVTRGLRCIISLTWYSNVCDVPKIGCLLKGDSILTLVSQLDLEI
jgi:hypothetical protein